jgi:dTDP-4-amino-4,6-dideoxygalactose transaminase
MDPEKLREYLETKCEFDSKTGKLVEIASKQRVAGIVPIHLYGQTADMDAILGLAEKYKLWVIEDACQAHGAQYFSKRDNAWKLAGSMGQAAAFSFYPGKNLGACGEAGAITTNDEAMAARMKMIRDHGQAKKYYHDIEGYNGRLDSIQAGWLSVKLRHLAKWNESRRALAHRYHELLSEVKDAALPPIEPSWSKGVYHLYVIRVQDREALQAALSEAGIGTGIHYPIPLHLQKAYRHLSYKQGDFPVTERLAAEIVSLPMFPQLTAAQQGEVAAKLREFVTARVSVGR